jgi:hypothetical protein
MNLTSKKNKEIKILLILVCQSNSEMKILSIEEKKLDTVLHPSSKKIPGLYSTYNQKLVLEDD